MSKQLARAALIVGCAFVLVACGPRDGGSARPTTGSVELIPSPAASVAPRATSGIEQVPPNKATCDDRYYTAIHAYAKQGAAARIRQILQGIDIRSLERTCRRHNDGSLNCGFTPLHLAVQSGSIDAARALLDAGFDVDSRYSEAVRYMQRARDGRVKVQLYACLQKIAGTPLVAASDSIYFYRKFSQRYGREWRTLQSGLIELLLKSGADPNPKGVGDNRHPLWLALPPIHPTLGNFEAAELLLKYNANPESACKATKAANNRSALEVLEATCRTAIDCNCDLSSL